MMLRVAFLLAFLVRQAAPLPPDGGRLVAGTVPDETRSAIHLGPADPSLPLERIVLVLRPRDPDAMARFLEAQVTPGTSEFHRWLTPAEFGRRFGAPAEEIGELVSWLGEQGLGVDEVTAGRTAVVVSGRVADVERAFGTRIGEYLHDGALRHSNDEAPSLPARLGRSAAGVLSLNDFPRRRPLSHPTPLNTSGSSHFLAPADFTAIYDVDPLHAAGIDGTGAKVAIVARTNITLSDTQFFRQYFGLPANDPVVVLNGPDPGILDSLEVLEANLDLQWSGAVAPNARVLLVVSKTTTATDGIDLSSLYSVNQDLADVIEVSFGECERDLGPVDSAFYQNVWAQAAAQGISVVVASGDTGVAGCDSPRASTGTVAGVNGLGSSPYDTCVGGTQFDDVVNPADYWDDTNDPVTKKSARGYIPETVWNESGANGGFGLLGAGGGVSLTFDKPSWQSGPGVPGDGKRDVPDVSLPAARHTAYLVARGSSTLGVSGTSASAPPFAGIAALLVTKGGRQGNLNPGLYALARTQPLSERAPVFHDVTTGSNSVPGLVGFAAGPGYDLASGLGSVDVSALAKAWPGATAAGADFTLNASPALFTLAPGASASVGLSLESAPGTDVAVSLSTGALPAGLTASFAPSRVSSFGTAGIASTGIPAVLTIAAPASAAAGTYAVVVTASAGGVSRSVTLRIAVGPGTALPVPPGIEVQVPVVLDVHGAGGSHYTSDLIATNRSGVDVSALLRFVPAPGTPGSGGPVAGRSLLAGRQLYVADVVADLRARGYAFPVDGSAKLGTLFVTFSGATDPRLVDAGSRVSTPNPNASIGGSYGLFASGVRSGSAAAAEAWVYGLRDNASYRSNLAVVHAPAASSSLAPGAPVGLEITVFDGDSGSAAGTPLTHTLQPGEFFQINRALATAGVSNGYVRVRRTSGTDGFIAYGVVNDGGGSGGTSDGSFIASGGTEGLVPIVLDVPGGTHYQTDLTLTNPLAATTTVTLTYSPTAAFAAAAGVGAVTTSLDAGRQLLVPDALGFLRGLGLKIPNDGSAQGGTLLVQGAVAQARVFNPNPDTAVGGTFGVAFPALDASRRARTAAWIYGLRQDDDFRSNLAIADARTTGAPAVDYMVELYDADAGSSSPVVTLTRSLAGGQWIQIDGVLSAAAIRHGHARVRPAAGSSDFIAYGVVNDGPTPGSRTSDGSYLPMVVEP